MCLVRNRLNIPEEKLVFHQLLPVGEILAVQDICYFFNAVTNPSTSLAGVCATWIKPWMLCATASKSTRSSHKILNTDVVNEYIAYECASLELSMKISCS
jgi:hypothetical protein